MTVRVTAGPPRLLAPHVAGLWSRADGRQPLHRRGSVCGGPERDRRRRTAGRGVSGSVISDIQYRYIIPPLGMAPWRGSAASQGPGGPRHRTVVSTGRRCWPGCIVPNSITRVVLALPSANQKRRTPYVTSRLPQCRTYSHYHGSECQSLYLSQCLVHIVPGEPGALSTDPVVNLVRWKEGNLSSATFFLTPAIVPSVSANTYHETKQE